jgi:hypothetical protein
MTTCRGLLDNRTPHAHGLELVRRRIALAPPALAVIRNCPSPIHDSQRETLLGSNWRRLGS